MSAYAVRPLKKAVLAALKADGTVTGFVGTRIRSMIRQGEEYPYVYIRDDGQDWDTKSDNGQRHTFDVFCYTRHTKSTSPQGPGVAEQVSEAVYDVLHNNNSLVLDGNNLILMRCTLSSTSQLSDAETWVCHLRFDVITQGA